MGSGGVTHMKCVTAGSQQMQGAMGSNGVTHMKCVTAGSQQTLHKCSVFPRPSEAWSANIIKHQRPTGLESRKTQQRGAAAGWSGPPSESPCSLLGPFQSCLASSQNRLAFLLAIVFTSPTSFLAPHLPVFSTPLSLSTPLAFLLYLPQL